MASVTLKFTPPDTEDLESLVIYEEANPAGPWDTIIETVNLAAIGAVYPEYISEYETDQATNAQNWFAIRWIGAKGAEGGLSNPIQGGSSTLVGDIVELVGQRDSTLDAQVVRQEAEFAIESYYSVDPYTVTETSLKRKIGLARLVQARSMLNRLAVGVGGASEGWTAGLVSMKSSSGTATESLIRYLLAEAANQLGLTYSRVAQMATMSIAGGLSAYEIVPGETILIGVE